MIEVRRSVIEVRHTSVDDWQTWRTLRLNALRLAPTAFGSTYAEAVAADEHYWRRWWIEMGDRALRCIAFVDGQPAGMIGCLNRPAGSPHTHLIAMWVEESFRGRGVADALIDEVVAWARHRGYQRLTLDVTEGNEVARRLYLRHGFTSTGEWEDCDSHPGLKNERMSRPL